MSRLTTTQRDALRQLTQILRGDGARTLDIWPAGPNTAYSVTDPATLAFIADVLDQATHDDEPLNPSWTPQLDPHGTARLDDVLDFITDALIRNQKLVTVRTVNPTAPTQNTYVRAHLDDILSDLINLRRDAESWRRHFPGKPLDAPDSTVDVDTTTAAAELDAIAKNLDCTYRHYNPLDQADRELLRALLADRIARLEATRD